MRLFKQAAICIASLAVMTAYCDYPPGNTEDSPADTPANPDNFNGTNATALTAVWTTNGQCQGLPQSAIEAVYYGNTCMSTTSGGLIVTCQYQGVPQYGWTLKFYSDDLACQSSPFISISGTGVGCYQGKATDGRTVSVYVDCGGGTKAQIQNPATFNTTVDSTLPTYQPTAASNSASGSNSGKASSTTNAPTVYLGTNSAVSTSATVGMIITGLTTLAYLL